jgi:hypothetical protein
MAQRKSEDERDTKSVEGLEIARRRLFEKNESGFGC